MAANITDYQALQNAKTKTDKDFDDMLANLNQAKAKVDQMNQESWKGASANVFNEVFEEIKTNIQRERDEFNKAMNERLKFWYESFSDEEKATVQMTNNM